MEILTDNTSQKSTSRIRRIALNRLVDKAKLRTLLEARLRSEVACLPVLSGSTLCDRMVVQMFGTASNDLERGYRPLERPDNTYLITHKGETLVNVSRVGRVDFPTVP